MAIGLPVPSPYGSTFRFSQWLGNSLGTKFGPRTISKEEDLPAWWTNPLRGTDGFVRLRAWLLGALRGPVVQGLLRQLHFELPRGRARGALGAGGRARGGAR